MCVNVLFWFCFNQPGCGAGVCVEQKCLRWTRVWSRSVCGGPSLGPLLELRRGSSPAVAASLPFCILSWAALAFFPPAPARGPPADSSSFFCCFSENSLIMVRAAGAGSGPGGLRDSVCECGCVYECVCVLCWWRRAEAQRGRSENSIQAERSTTHTHTRSHTH